MTSDTARANAAAQQDRKPVDIEANDLWALAVYHGDTGQTTLAYFNETVALEQYNMAVKAITNRNGVLSLSDDIGTLLCLPVGNIYAVRLVTQAGQRKLQVSGNVESVRQQMATQAAMKEHFGMVANAGLVDNFGRPLNSLPRNRN